MTNMTHWGWFMLISGGYDFPPMLMELLLLAPVTSSSWMMEVDQVGVDFMFVSFSHLVPFHDVPFSLTPTWCCAQPCRAPQPADHSEIWWWCYPEMWKSLDGDLLGRVPCKAQGEKQAIGCHQANRIDLYADVPNGLPRDEESTATCLDVSCRSLQSPSFLKLTKLAA